MSASFGKRLASASIMALVVSVISGCTITAGAADVAGKPTPAISGTERLTAVSTANPDLQGFLDTWGKDGVTIAETPATGDSLLVAFTDENDNSIPDENEQVLAQIDADLSDISELSATEQSGGTVTGRCSGISYIVEPGEFTYRGKTFTVKYSGRAFDSYDSCPITLTVSSDPFPGEHWVGLLKGTKNNEPFDAGWVITYPVTNDVQIEIPYPTSQDMLLDVYGRVGELAIASTTWNGGAYPDERMIVGSWKSEVTFNNE